MKSLDSFFTQFLGILSHKAREKAVLPRLENLIKSLEDKELQIKNQDKTTTNFTRRFTKKKAKLLLNQPKDSQDLEPRLMTKCKLYEKKHVPNKC